MSEERREYWVNTYGMDTVYSICANHAYLNRKDSDMNAAPGRIDCVHAVELRSDEKIVKSRRTTMIDWIVGVSLFILLIGIVFELVNIHYKIRSLEENQNDFNSKNKPTPETKKTMWG